MSRPTERATTLYLTMCTALTAWVGARLGADRERGDVPGWVLITVMTAALVVVIWGVARDQLTAMFQRAIQSVANLH